MREGLKVLGLKMGPSDFKLFWKSIDEDGGGYLDAQEAKTMIRSLLEVAEKARRDKSLKERQMAAMRREACRKEKLALSPSAGPEDASTGQPPQDTLTKTEDATPRQKVERPAAKRDSKKKTQKRAA